MMKGVCPYNPIPPSLPRQTLRALPYPPLGGQVAPGNRCWQSSTTMTPWSCCWLRQYAVDFSRSIIPVDSWCSYPLQKLPRGYTLAETRMTGKHFLSTVRFEHYFSGLNGVPFRCIHWEMNVISSETKFAEYKSKAFEFTKSFDTGIDVTLFSKTVVITLGFKHHHHPIITGVTRNLFRATATFTNQIYHLSCRTFIGQALCLPRATKKW